MEKSDIVKGYHLLNQLDSLKHAKTVVESGIDYKIQFNNCYGVNPDEELTDFLVDWINRKIVNTEKDIADL